MEWDLCRNTILYGVHIHSNRSAMSVRKTWSWYIIMLSKNLTLKSLSESRITANIRTIHHRSMHFCYKNNLFTHFCMPGVWWWSGWVSIRAWAFIWMNTVPFLKNQSKHLVKQCATLTAGYCFWAMVQMVRYLSANQDAGILQKIARCWWYTYCVSGVHTFMFILYFTRLTQCEKNEKWWILVKPTTED